MSLNGKFFEAKLRTFRCPKCVHISLKGQCQNNVNFNFFHESVSPKPLSRYTVRDVLNFSIFSNICGDIRSSRCTTGVLGTGGKWKKSSIRKVSIIFVDTFLASMWEYSPETTVMLPDHGKDLRLFCHWCDVNHAPAPYKVSVATV